MSSNSLPPSTTGSDSDSSTAGSNTADGTTANANAAAANNFHIVEHQQGSPSALIHPITQVNRPPTPNTSSMNNAANQDNHDQRITECITDAMSTLDPANYVPQGPITDVIPHPHSPFGHLYYHAIRNNPVVMLITNNASISMLALRIFGLMRHFNLSGQSPDDETMLDNLLSPFPFRSMTGLSQTFLGVGGGGDGGDDDHDNGDDDNGDDSDDSDFHSKDSYDDVNGLEHDGDDWEMEETAQYIREHRKALSTKAIEGNIVQKNKQAVATFLAFVHLAIEATQISLRAAQVEVRSIGQAIEQSVGELQRCLQ
eukprot:scaffold106805_cov44-Cyclotella_meneghiniana.AAC.3